MTFNDIIMLRRKAVSTDSMGGQDGEYADLQLAHATITPIRAKSGLMEGGKKAIGTYKLVTWAAAFADAGVDGVQQGDQFIWQTNGDKVLNFEVQHHKPFGDAFAEYEVTLTEG
ncbi:MAG: hypothetical protein HRU29_11625 [Rhizobiales bacterium]|nr:hypothetical protein [Hyphomicrobiales bacterium]NRB15039.1 hypothetical protein [Hyphomicrobiales bacterium]